MTDDDAAAADVDGPVIKAHVPSVDGTAHVELMEGPADLVPYQRADGALTADDHVQIVADHIVVPDLDADQVERLSMSDVAALFEHIVQDATDKVAMTHGDYDGSVDAFHVTEHRDPDADFDWQDDVGTGTDGDEDDGDDADDTAGGMSA